MCIRDRGKDTEVQAQQLAIRQDFDKAPPGGLARNRGCCRDDLEPVSYTHLDVYKRQDLRCRRLVTLAGNGDFYFRAENEIRAVLMVGKQQA